MEWQEQRIDELQQVSSVGRLMRRYEGEVARLRAQHEEERRDLREQLAATGSGTAVAAAVPWAASVAAQQQGRGAVELHQAPHNTNLMPLDSAAWAAALFGDGEPCPQGLEALEACTQTEDSRGALPPLLGLYGSDGGLGLDAAQQEVERLQLANARLQEGQTQSEKAGYCTCMFQTETAAMCCRACPSLPAVQPFKHCVMKWTGCAGREQHGRSSSSWSRLQHDTQRQPSVSG